MELHNSAQGPEGTGATEPAVPWDLGDVAKALAAPAFFVVVGLLTIVLGGDQDEDLDQGALIIGLIFTVGLQLFLLGSVFWLGIRKHRATWDELGLRPWRAGWWFPLALLGASLAVVYAYAGILRAVGIKLSDVPEEVFDNIAPTIILGVISVGLAPVIEEIFFRGFVFGALRSRFGLAVGVAASGFIFGAAHLSSGSLLVLFPISGVGMIFAWGYAHSGSILPTIVAHFFFNLLVFSLGVLSA